MPICTRPLPAGYHVPYVTHSCPDHPHPDHHCPVMTGALRRTLLLHALPDILPGYHPLGPDLLRPIRLVLGRMCRLLDIRKLNIIRRLLLLLLVLRLLCILY